jgi:hypothetical protein
LAVGRRHRKPERVRALAIVADLFPAYLAEKTLARDHACGCVITGIWLALCAASLISVPPWPSLAATKLDAM